MPKREEHVNKTIVDVLKQNNCVFFAPLSKETGIVDLITGVQGIVPSNSQGYWDEQEQAYKFHSPDRIVSAIFPDTNIFINESWPFVHTLIYTAKCIQKKSVYDSIVSIGGNPDDNSYFHNNQICCYYNDINQHGLSMNIWRCLSQVYDNQTSQVRVYTDFVLQEGKGRVTTIQSYNIDYLKKSISFIGANSYWYLKNVMLFNRVLSVDEMQEMNNLITIYN